MLELEVGVGAKLSALEWLIEGFNLINIYSVKRYCQPDAFEKKLFLSAWWKQGLIKVEAHQCDLLRIQELCLHFCLLLLLASKLLLPLKTKTLLMLLLTAHSFFLML